MIAIVLALVLIGAILEMLKSKIAIDDTILWLIRLIIIIGVVYFVWGWFGFRDLPLPGRVSH